MAQQGPNAFAYVFPAVLLGAVALYFVYGAVDRAALGSQQGEAQVTGKQVTPASTTYVTEAVGGRTYTKPRYNPEAYVVALKLAGEATGAAVSQQLYESLQPGDRVRVKYQRTRLTKRVLVTDLSR
jgi:hypothetical protein